MATKAPSALISTLPEPKLPVVVRLEVEWLTRVSAPVERLYRYTSLGVPLASVAPRSVDWVTKATEAPSALITGLLEPPLLAVVSPAAEWLTRVVVPDTRSYRNTSLAL